MSDYLSCPHCGSASTSGSQFCEACGKALPTENSTGPRVIGADEIAQTRAGRRLQGDELQKEIKKATGALLAVAVIQTVVALILYFVQQAAASFPHPRIPGLENFIAGLAIFTLLIAAVYWGLYSWSQSQPLPAAIVGLVIYGTLVALNIFVTVTSNAQTTSNNTGFRGIGVGWLDFVIIGLLVRGITAGAAHRKLLRQLPQPPPLPEESLAGAAS